MIPGAQRTVEVDVTAAAQYRVEAVDPLLRLSARVALTSLFGVVVSAHFSPAEAAGLSVVEWGVQAGGGVRVEPLTWLQVQVVGLVGFVHHTYSSSTDQGQRWDFLGSLALGGTWRLNRAVGLQLWLSPGLTEQSRTHHRGGQALWSRSRFRLELGGGVVLGPF
jgi:hypothetical protein